MYTTASKRKRTAKQPTVLSSKCATKAKKQKVNQVPVYDHPDQETVASTSGVTATKINDIVTSLIPAVTQGVVSSFKELGLIHQPKYQKPFLF